MEQQSFDKTKLVSSLLRVGHGNLDLFVEAGLAAAKNEPNLFAHIVAWNHKKSKVKDSKVAFPVIALRGVTKDQPDLAENAIAHIVSLGPRELLRSYQFSKKMTKDGLNIPGGYRRMLESALKKYIQVREDNIDWWDSSVVSNRKAMTAIYTIAHKKPNDRAQDILFNKKYPNGSVFEAIAKLKTMLPVEAAGTILKFGIPFPIAVGAVSKAKDQDILLALIENMSGNEVINNTSMLKQFGVFDTPALKSAYDHAVERAKDDRRVNTFKASKAVDVIAKTDKDAAKKLIAIQDRQEKKLSGIEGNWLILGDRSLSMHESIVIAKNLAAVLAAKVKGNIYLAFFNSSPLLIDVTGKSSAEIEQETKNITASGSTSIGCGLDSILSRGIVVNGIAIVSDGGENTQPYFITIYKKYCDKIGVEPTVYLFHVPGDQNVLESACRNNDIQIETFELNKDFDYYSLPNVVNTLKTSRYALLDEIMETPLLKFKQVFERS